jgi:hypothetical protein
VTELSFPYERTAAFQNHPLIPELASATTQPNQKGKIMLLPALIFLMILFPVLLPAGITAVDAIKRAYRRNLAPRRFAVPATA